MTMCLTFLMSPLAIACSAISAVRAITTGTVRNNRYSFMFSSFWCYCVDPPCTLTHTLCSVKFPASLAHPRLQIQTKSCNGVVEKWELRFERLAHAFLSRSDSDEACRTEAALVPSPAERDSQPELYPSSRAAAYFSHVSMKTFLLVCPWCYWMLIRVRPEL